RALAGASRAEPRAVRLARAIDNQPVDAHQVDRWPDAPPQPTWPRGVRWPLHVLVGSTLLRHLSVAFTTRGNEIDQGCQSEEQQPWSYRFVGPQRLRAWDQVNPVNRIQTRKHFQR